MAEGGKAMSLMDAAVNILSQGTGDPMRCKDIVDLAIKRGLWAPRTGKTPASTLYAAILREITGRRRDRVYAYHEYLRVLSPDTD